jgi:hypothetical protein
MFCAASCKIGYATNTSKADRHGPRVLPVRERWANIEVHTHAKKVEPTG